uniref:TNFR-Cys domain-containing protein n=1 Tax=Magallana gigas TaxID=29159 RepID=A0A8W8K4H1_MAGGI|nr:scavenger receptor class F member 1 isoform X1 [Crassostrea gigas]
MKLLRLLLFTVCVLTVLGVCPDGKYGPQCSLTCGSCKNITCHEDTGVCQGCSAGYLGLLCVRECTIGTYGENCLLSCNQCVNNTCDPVNGTCTNGTKQTTSSTSTTAKSTTTSTKQTTTTQEKGLIFDSPAVFLGFSIQGLGLVGAGALILFLIIAILCHTALNRCCPRKVQVEPTYHAKRRRSERSTSFMYRKWSSSPT